jgi:hypothetical protein
MARSFASCGFSLRYLVAMKDILAPRASYSFDISVGIRCLSLASVALVFSDIRRRLIGRAS